ncbi:MAG TPA: ABC transporter permease, partial [Pyrinomonadaceae bacterium]|nr:ABC transporter permease [Pyrinomonadaceae bacterium]
MKLLRSDIYENLKMALATLRTNKLRSVLTVVGVIIGVWTVMAIASIISGIDLAVTKEIESFGTRSIILTKFETGIQIGRRSREERMRKELTFEDAMALRALPAVELSVPFLDITNNFFGSKINVSANGKTSSAVRLQGTLPDYERAGIENVSEGRFFSEFENDQNQQVCVVGASVVESFFPFGSPLEQELDIGGNKFRIIGVFEKREQLGGGGGNNDESNVIYMPYNVARKLKPNADDV